MLCKIGIEIRASGNLEAANLIIQDSKACDTFQYHEEMSFTLRTLKICKKLAKRNV
jgi:hypothetical protein